MAMKRQIIVSIGLNGCLIPTLVNIAPCEDGKYRLSTQDINNIIRLNFGREPMIGETINYL
jgi:hypothetical protein